MDKPSKRTYAWNSDERARKRGHRFYWIKLEGEEEWERSTLAHIKNRLSKSLLAIVLDGGEIQSKGVLYTSTMGDKP